MDFLQTFLSTFSNSNLLLEWARQAGFANHPAVVDRILYLMVRELEVPTSVPSGNDEEFAAFLQQNQRDWESITEPTESSTQLVNRKKRSSEDVEGLAQTCLEDGDWWGTPPKRQRTGDIYKDLAQSCLDDGEWWGPLRHVPEARLFGAGTAARSFISTMTIPPTKKCANPAQHEILSSPCPVTAISPPLRGIRLPCPIPPCPPPCTNVEVKVLTKPSIPIPFLPLDPHLFTKAPLQPLE